MLRKTFLVAATAMLMTLAMSSRAEAWGGGFHMGYTHYSPYTGLHHYGYTGVARGGYGYGGGYRYGGGYHYGGYSAYGGERYGGYHYGGYAGAAYGGYRAGYYRRW